MLIYPRKLNYLKRYNTMLMVLCGCGTVSIPDLGGMRVIKVNSGWVYEKRGAKSVVQGYRYRIVTDALANNGDEFYFITDSTTFYPVGTRVSIVFHEWTEPNLNRLNLNEPLDHVGKILYGETP